LINLEFAKKQNLNEEDIQKLNILYKQLECIFDKAEKSNEENELAALSMELESLEYELQRTWKLDPDISRHSYWFRIPKCTCPKMDNADRWGTDTRIFDSQCIVHKHLFTHISNMRH